MPTQARAIVRVDTMLDALAMILADGGAGAVTTKAVAALAGTSVGSVYEYFPNRDALLGALAQRYADELDRSSSADDSVVAVVEGLCEFWRTHPALPALWWQIAPGAGSTAAGELVRNAVVEFATRELGRGVAPVPPRVREAARLIGDLVAGGMTPVASSARQRAKTQSLLVAVVGSVASLVPELDHADITTPATDEPVRGIEGLPTPVRTRSQRVLDGRERILDAAVDQLVRRGYGGATTLAIQHTAGVSRGRLLHQFPSRDLLLVAAAEHLAERRVRATRERVVETVRADRIGAQRIEHVVELMWASYQEPHFWAASELWMVARTNREIATALGSPERRLGATIRAAVGEMFGDAYSGAARFPMLRDLLLTSMRGVAMTYGFDPRTSERDSHLQLWKDLAHILLPDEESSDAEQSALTV